MPPIVASSAFPSYSHLDALRGGDSHAENERAKKEKEGRLGFLKFHRRNSVASARSASATPSSFDVSESDAGTEPPSSQCNTPGPAPEQEHLSAELESVSISRRLYARAATITAWEATRHKQMWLLRTGSDGSTPR